MMESPLSFRELLLHKQQELLEDIQMQQELERADIPEEALTWLALPPVWTLALAEACHFPMIAGFTVRETLQRLNQERLCAFISADEELLAEDETMRGEERYVVSKATRTEILQKIRLHPQKGIPYLQQIMQEIGQAILQAIADGMETLLQDERWARLASKAQDHKAVAYLLRDEIKALLDEKQSGEVVGWIEVAQPIEELLGGQLTTTLLWGGRQLELFHRRNDDMRYLHHFQAQDNHIQAFSDFVRGSDAWALHYVGDGGVGKTMLMRHVTAVLAAEMQLSIARIDFDYLNPDYPLRQPGLLLDQLATELRLQDAAIVDTATSLFASFDVILTRLHERLGSVPVGIPTFQALTEDFSFQNLIGAFAEAITNLPQQPVVLLLDTCEELAKIRPDGTIPESVQATFYILEQLQALVSSPRSSLRVVFCGRRPLAAQGFDWSYNLPDQLHLYGTETSWWNTARPYLQLCEMRGFTRQEAENYLGTKMEISSDLIQPVLKRSLEREGQQRFLFAHSAVQAEKEAYYKPFDLALYAAWIQEEPGITAEALEQEQGDRYVERRIIARNPALKEILPIIVLLRRFKWDVLRSIIQMEPQHFENLYQELLQLEWIDHQPAQFFEVSQGLLPRLHLFYQQTEPKQLETARNSIVTFLERYTLESPFSQLDISYFDTTLFLLRQEPERAIRWWLAVEKRCAKENAYAWMRSVTELLLQSAEVSIDPSVVSANAQDRLLRAAILATYAAILLHTSGTNELATYWQVVERELEGVDQPEVVRLRDRACAGQIVAVYANGQEADEPLLERFLRYPWYFGRNDEQVIASFVAASEAILEYVEGVEERAKQFNDLLILERHRRLLWRVERELFLIEDWNDEVSFQDLLAFGRTLLARCFLLTKENEYASSLFQRFLQRSLERSGPERSNPQPWLDWRAPDDIAARVRLEFIRALYPAILAPEKVVEEISLHSFSHPRANIDGDRLAAAVQTLKATFSYEPIGEEQWKTADQSQMYQPVCLAHTAFPPLFAVIARAMAESGNVDASINYLMNRSKHAEQRADAAETLESDRACLNIVRRMRLRDEGVGISSSVLSSRDLQDQELLRVLNVLDGKKNASFLHVLDTPEAFKESGDVVRSLHIFWRTSSLIEAKPEAIKTLYETSSSIVFNPEQFEQASCVLDQYEAYLLNRLHGWPQSFPKLNATVLREIAQHWSQRPEKPIEAFTLCLRINALTNYAVTNPPFGKQIGKRRAAAIALDEGELLAFRLSAQALSLLNKARVWFAEVGDYASAFIADTCAALVLARTDTRDGLSVTLQRSEKDYELFRRATKVTLPAWNEIEAIAEVPTGEALDGLQVQGWRPWLVRLICCMIYQKDDNTQKDRVSELMVWLLNHYGATVGSEVALPAELDSLLRRIPVPIRFTSPIESVPEEPKLVRGTRVRLEINPVTQLYEVEETLSRLIEVHLTAYVGEDVSLLEMKVTGKNAYREMADDLQSEKRELRRIIPQAFIEDHTLDNPLIIELQVNSQISSICWEGILACMLTDTPVMQLQFRRVSFAYKSGYGIRKGMLLNLVSWVNNKQQAEIARRSWQSLSPCWIGESEDVRERFQFSKDKSAAEVSVLYLVGDPIETSRGVRLRSATALYESLSSRGGDLLRVGEEVPQIFPYLEFCILQVASKERLQRTSRERNDAAYMRTLATELFEAGVPAVVALPSLPTEITIRVLQQFAGALQNSRLSFFRAIEKAQLLMLDEGLEEQAYDLCLYAGSEFE